MLIAVGLLVNASPFIGLDLHTWRFEGVTQRIALCYFVAAILVLWSDYRGQLMAIIVCLVGYWALLRFVPVPGLGVPGRDIPFMDPDKNIVAWLDRKLFMGHLFDGTRDPEGLLQQHPCSCNHPDRSAYGPLAESKSKPRRHLKGDASFWNFRLNRR